MKNPIFLASHDRCLLCGAKRELVFSHIDERGAHYKLHPCKSCGAPEGDVLKCNKTESRRQRELLGVP